MAAREIKTVGIISTGVIGASWTALFLAHGLNVIACSPSPGAHEKLTAYLDKVWPTFDTATLPPTASLSNLRFVGSSLDGYYDEVDFIQENAPERPDLKTSIFAGLDAACRPDVILASSSSGFPASRFIGECKAHPERVLVGHPYNPPHLIPLVEVVPHPGTDPSVSERALAFYRSVGRRPVLVRKEVPGFVANRLQCALVAEAYSLVLRGVASADEIDTCMTDGLGLRWAFTGPFMTNVLGGGGGRDGFRRIAAGNILPAAKFWAEDMREHAFDFDAKHIPTLDASVQEMLDKYDMEAFLKWRDRMLLDVLKAKEDSEATSGK